MIPVLASSLVVFVGIVVYIVILDTRLKKIATRKNE
jgi:CcmD family protein